MNTFFDPHSLGRLPQNVRVTMTFWSAIIIEGHNPPRGSLMKLASLKTVTSLNKESRLLKFQFP